MGWQARSMCSEEKEYGREQTDHGGAGRAPRCPELSRLGFVVDAVLDSLAQQDVPFIVPVPNGEHRRELGSLPKPH